ncbi:hypothetical protein Tco_1178760, partial [Tanacetum coccineum]
MAQIMECLGRKTGGLDQINGKDAMILYCLAREEINQLLVNALQPSLQKFASKQDLNITAENLSKSFANSTIQLPQSFQQVPAK